MTGKKITNTSGKGRGGYQNASNHQIANVAGKPSTVPPAVATVTAPISPSTANHNFGAVPPPLAAGSGAGNGGAIVVPTVPQANFSTLIKTAENAKYLPRYAAALAKPNTDLFPADELDGVQLELELLLSTVALRYRSLKSGVESLDREEKNHKKSGKYVSVGQGKRKRDESNKKLTKDAKGAQPTMKVAKLKPSSSDPAAEPKPLQQPQQQQQQHQQQPQQQQQQQVQLQQPQSNADDTLDGVGSPTRGQSSASGLANPKVLVPKNDVPNKFWLSVEPYCMPITHEDVKLLDELLEEYTGPLVPPIPDLGPHYTSRWAAEDLRDEQDNSNPNAKANKRFTNAANPEVNNIMKKGEKLVGEGE